MFPERKRATNMPFSTKAYAVIANAARLSKTIKNADGKDGINTKIASVPAFISIALSPTATLCPGV
jgi:hypothetical protein